MENDSIVITAKLNVQASQSLIEHDLDEIQKNIKPIEIKCAINDTALKNLQSQISEFSKGLTLNVGAVNAQSIQQSINEATQNQGVKINVSTEIDKNVINKDVDTIKKLFQLGLKGNTLTEFRQELKPLLQEFADAYKSLDTERLQSSFQKVLSFIDRTKNEAIVLDDALKQAQTTLRDLLSYEGKVSIDNPTKGDLLTIFNNNEKQVEQVLNTVFGKLNWEWSNLTNRLSHSGFDTIAEQFKIEANNLAEGIAGLYDQLSKPVPKGNIFNVLESETDILNALAGSLKLPTEIYEFIGGDIWATGKPMEGLKVEIQGVDSAMQSLATDASQAETAVDALLNDINKYPNITKITSGFSTDNSAQLDAAKTQLNEYFKNVAQVEDNATRIKRAVSDTEGELTRFYVQVEKSDKSVETLTYALNEQGTAYEFLSKAIREADNSTDFRRKGLDVQKEIKTEDVNKFITQLKEANLYTGDLKTRADELKNSIAQVTDTNAMNKFLDDFDIAKAKFAAMKEESRSYNNSLKDTESYINKAVAALEKFNNASVTKRNASNADVIAQTGTNANLISQLQGLSQSLKDDSSAANLQRVRQVIDTLSGSIEKATTDSASLNQQLRNMGAEDRLSNQIRNLTNQMANFANVNKKATESLRLMSNGVTFADEWKRITEALKSGKLDENAIKQLAQDFKNFKAQAQSAGITVSQFFTSMQSQIRMVLQRWISLYAIVGRVTSAFNELKEVDKILTEIAKSSDVARESLQSLGDSAFEMANKYGRAASDYLYGVQEFSRAGFRGDQLTGLTEISLLAQSAGDIETDLANSYVIATNAAYEFEGSQEKLGEVLDRQNYVTNNYALNMTDLANSTKIAASQAAQSGVEIDEMTAALATMISTTQQGGEIAARAFRGKRALSTIALYRCEPIIA